MIKKGEADKSVTEELKGNPHSRHVICKYQLEKEAEAGRGN